MRVGRTDGRDDRYHGAAGRQPPAPVSVSAVETYLTCPFKYFAKYVLGLEEERDEEEVMDPKAQGQFVHAVFEAFFKAWQDSGRRDITPQNLDDASALFAQVVEDKVRPLPEAEAALERTRLLGSPWRPGSAKSCSAWKPNGRRRFVERLLEYRLRGEFEFGGTAAGRDASRSRASPIASTCSRTARSVSIDYKLSSAPSKSRALQLPIYGLCAEQRLKAYNGRDWTLGEAAYIAFRGAKTRDAAVLRRGRIARRCWPTRRNGSSTPSTRIERGEFPPTPEDVFLCGFCSYAAVCRKDYVGDV